jgi:hypothetical protein
VDKKNWEVAMRKEYQSLQENKTWDLVDLLAVSRCLKVKSDAEGNVKYKARLIGRGFTQVYGNDYFETQWSGSHQLDYC